MRQAHTRRSFIKPHFHNLASSRTALQGFTAEIDREPGHAENAGPYPAMTTQHILLARKDTKQSTRLEWTLNGSRQDHSFPTGNLILNPAGLLTRPQWNQDVDLHILAIDSTHLTSETEFDLSRSPELVPRYGFRDELLTGLLHAITDELRCDHPDALYMETMAAAASQHLLRHYTSHGAPAAEPATRMRGRLPAARLRELHEYMRAHLGRKISLSELAAIAGVSTSHFARIFRQSTGVAPHQRLTAMRLQRSEDLLRGSGLTIAEIAALTGFADQSHLTRLFHQYRGVTPARFRRRP